MKAKKTVKNARTKSAGQIAARRFGCVEPIVDLAGDSSGPRVRSRFDDPANGPRVSRLGTAASMMLTIHFHS